MSTRVTTGKVRFSYFSALTARKNEMNGKEEFSTQVRSNADRGYQGSPD